MTIARAAEPEIAAVAREEGMLTLREDGVVQGPRRRHQPRGGAPCHSLISTSPRCCASMVETQRLRRPHHRRLPAGDPRQGQDPADGGLPGAERAADPRGRLRDPQRRPAQTLREQPAARLRLRDPRRRPLPRQLLLPARLGQRRLPPGAAGDPGARLARGAAGAARADRRNRAASSSSPARPARARARPWRR